MIRLRPDRRYTLAAAVGGAIAALSAVFTTDPAGRLLSVVAAVVLAAYTGADVLYSPRVSAGPEGIVLNAPLNRTRLAWSEVESISADTRTRYGLSATTLEIDAGATLVIFSRRSIGTDPASAAALLLSVDPRWGGRAGGADDPGR